MSSDPERLTAYLDAAKARYPGAWLQVHDFRKARGRGLPTWPEWCFMPLAGAYAIVSGGGSNTVPLDQMTEVPLVGALAAWRETKGIYDYDETVMDALWSTPVEGEIPTEILRRLPEWCVYIPTPGRRAFDADLLGFFAHLESDAGTSREELRLLLDFSDRFIPIPLHLDRGGLAQSIVAMRREAERQMMLKHGLSPEDARDWIGANLTAHVASVAEPLVSVLLYLCAEASEVHERVIEGAGRVHPRRPPHRRPTAPTTWAVAYRLGAAIREAQAREDREASTGDHARPRAHVRRAHWHTYLTGEGRARPVLKWLPPIPVNVDLGDIVPTIRRVE